MTVFAPCSVFCSISPLEFGIASTPAFSTSPRSTNFILIPITMKFSTTFLSTALLIGSSLAAPPRGLAERIQTRSAARGSSHQSQPMQRLLVNPEHKELANSVQYSNNWAGAVYETQPEEGPFYAVAGTFTVPEPKTVGEAGGGGVTAGSAWVGIDGDTYGAAILQAGVDFYIQPNGSTFYDAWYEWFPDYAYDFEMDVIAGDVVSIYVETYSPSEGYVYIENQSTGQTASQVLKAPTEKAMLAGQNAEWIVEDFQSGGKLVNLVDFGTVTFTDAQVGAGNVVKGVRDATRIELKQGDKVYTETTVVDDMVLNVHYKG